jgi:exonuclease III
MIEKPQELKILSINTDGYASKKEKIIGLYKRLKIDIACMQETGTDILKNTKYLLENNIHAGGSGINRKLGVVGYFLIKNQFRSFLHHIN